MRVVRRVAAVLATYGLPLVLVLFAVTWLGLRVTRHVDSPMATTTSTAMRPTIAPGDLVLLHDTDPGTVLVGDVVAYRDPDDGELVFGRISDRDQRGSFFEYLAVGDNRPPEDADPIEDGDVVGELDRTLPLLGYGLVVLRSPAGQLLVAAATSFGIAATYRARYHRRRARRIAEELTPEVPEEPRALPYGGASRIEAPTDPPEPEPAPPSQRDSMSITPAELRHVRFAQVRRGYDTEAVDRALESVADSIEELLHERHELQERIRGLEGEIERYREVESTLSQTLVLAERAAEELKAEAQVEADRLLADARARAAATPAPAPSPSPAPAAAPAAPASAPAMGDAAFVELLGETRAIRSLLQAVLTQAAPGAGPAVFQPRQPSPPPPPSADQGW